MASGSKSKVKGRKGKIGRNKHRIAAYFASGRNKLNKGKRLNKHLRRFPDDLVAREALKVVVAALPLALSRQIATQT